MMKYVHSHYKDLRVTIPSVWNKYSNEDVFPLGLSRDQTIISTTFQKQTICWKISHFSRVYRVDVFSEIIETVPSRNACFIFSCFISQFFSVLCGCCYIYQLSKVTKVLLNHFRITCYLIVLLMHFCIFTVILFHDIAFWGMGILPSTPLPSLHFPHDITMV